jgi:probable HAF family extracellular repeat protein
MRTSVRRLNLKSKSSLAAAAFLAAAGLSHAAGQSYSVTDLGLPAGGINSSAGDINNAGQIVGSYQDTSFNFHALYWAGSSVQSTALPTAGGATSSQAGGINDSGAIIGSYTTVASTFACTWSGKSSTPTALAKPSGASIYYGSGINNSGLVTGFYRDASSNYQACYWPGVAFGAVALGNPSGAVQSYAGGVNAKNQIVGSYQGSTSAYQACFWSGPSVTPTTLPTPAGTLSSQASGINSQGQIVGAFSTTAVNLNGAHACIWNGSTVTDLNTLIDPASGWLLKAANGINDAGQIIGTGTINGFDHAVLLTPLPARLTLAGKKKLVTSHHKITLHGTDSGFVTSITGKLGKKTLTATGDTSWKLSVPLNRGRNVVTIVAHGPASDSAPVKVIILRD